MDKRINPLQLNAVETEYKPPKKVSESVAVTKVKETESAPKTKDVKSKAKTTTKTVKPTAENPKEVQKTDSVKWYVKAWNTVKHALIVAGIATGKFFVKLWNVIKNYFINLYKDIFDDNEIYAQKMADSQEKGEQTK